MHHEDPVYSVSPVFGDMLLGPQSPHLARWRLRWCRGWA